MTLLSAPRNNLSQRLAGTLAVALALGIFTHFRPESIADDVAVADQPAIAELPGDDEPAHAEMPYEEVLAGETSAPTLVLIQGDAATPEKSALWTAQAERWRHAAERGGLQFRKFGGDRNTARLHSLRRTLVTLDADGHEELWIVLIGEMETRNGSRSLPIHGKPLTSSDLAKALERFHRPLAVINGLSTNEGLVRKLAGPQRAIVSATSEGETVPSPRFADWLSRAIADPNADTDRDGQTSLLEASVFASRKTEESYFANADVPPEHAQLDDTSDGTASRPRFTQPASISPSSASIAAPDGLLAHQFCLLRSEEERQLPASIRSQRDELERRLSLLRLRKPQMPEADYYAALEPLLLQIAQLTAHHP